MEGAGSFGGLNIPFIYDGTIVAKLAVMMSTVAPAGSISPGSRRCKLTTGVTAICVGLTSVSKTDGQAGSVQMDGVAIGTSNAAITVGQELVADAAGKLGPVTYVAGASQFIVGTALSATTATDQDVEVQLRLNRQQGD